MSEICAGRSGLPRLSTISAPGVATRAAGGQLEADKVAVLRRRPCRLANLPAFNLLRSIGSIVPPPRFDRTEDAEQAPLLTRQLLDRLASYKHRRRRHAVASSSAPARDRRCRCRYPSPRSEGSSRTVGRLTPSSSQLSGFAIRSPSSSRPVTSSRDRAAACPFHAAASCRRRARRQPSSRRGDASMQCAPRRRHRRRVQSHASRLCLARSSEIR